MASLTSHSASANVKTYAVGNIQNLEPVLSGKGDDPLWKNAMPLSDFSYPWENDVPPLTTFKALHNTDWLFLLYATTDENINIYVNKNEKEEVNASDRVEIFLRADDRLDPYYGLEIDPSGRVMDFRVSYHRKFDWNWTWPREDLRIKSSIQPIGYTVEIAISKRSLSTLGLLKDNRIEAGLYRGNCVSLTGSDALLKWISWVRPDSETPDFHVPSSFGLLILEE